MQRMILLLASGGAEREARTAWESAASPAQLNQMIGQLVGPSLVTADGRLLPARQKTEATGLTVASDVPGGIAGGRYDPVHMAISGQFRGLIAA